MDPLLSRRGGGPGGHNAEGGGLLSCFLLSVHLYSDCTALCPYVSACVCRSGTQGPPAYGCGVRCRRQRRYNGDGGGGGGGGGHAVAAVTVAVRMAARTAAVMEVW